MSSNSSTLRRNMTSNSELVDKNFKSDSEITRSGVANSETETKIPKLASAVAKTVLGEAAEDKHCPELRRPKPPTNISQDSAATCQFPNSSAWASVPEIPGKRVLWPATPQLQTTLRAQKESILTKSRRSSSSKTTQRRFFDRLWFMASRGKTAETRAPVDLVADAYVTSGNMYPANSVDFLRFYELVSNAVSQSSSDGIVRSSGREETPRSQSPSKEHSEYDHSTKIVPRIQTGQGIIPSMELLESDHNTETAPTIRIGQGVTTVGTFDITDIVDAVDLHVNQTHHTATSLVQSRGYHKLLDIGKDRGLSADRISTHDTCKKQSWSHCIQEAHLTLPTCLPTTPEKPLADNPTTHRPGLSLKQMPERLDPKLFRHLKSPVAILEPSTWHDITKERFSVKERAEDEKDLHTLLGEAESINSPNSPTNVANYRDSDDGGYETPLTSPSTSPSKTRPNIHRFESLVLERLQLDGGRSSIQRSSETPFETLEDDSVSVEITVHDEISDVSERIVSEEDPQPRPKRCSADLSAVMSHDISQFNPIFSPDDDATPMTRASKAKTANAFSFPLQCHAVSGPALGVQRYPCKLLRHNEHISNERRHLFVNDGSHTRDRFIASRANTPTKESYLLRTPVRKQNDSTGYSRFTFVTSDPFGPGPSRSVRADERFATIRRLSPSPRRGGWNGTVIPTNPSMTNQTAGADALWTVGGAVVTEGVASVTNGRGGRVTSGTSAPHYTADFLRRQSPSEEELQHAQRLAIAMDVEQNARMLEITSLSSTMQCTIQDKRHENGRRSTFWSNGIWERDLLTSPSRWPQQKPKEVPIIPFRVLDAPALRDDYYCSLLAYSPTIHCLAVGIGPHVYLWTEARGTTPTHLPDSLTAPFGAHVTSVSFSSIDGGSAILAVGHSNGHLTLWSPQDREPRINGEHPAPVSCVCFRSNAVKRQSVREPTTVVTTEELLVGDEAGSVYFYSVEWPCQSQRDLFDWHGSMTLLARIGCHSQQICGLGWSADGEFFATGGNDNQLFLFERKRVLNASPFNTASYQTAIPVRNVNPSGDGTVIGQGPVLNITSGQQKHLFTLNAAVKAIAFAPWQSSLLAAGGGSNDRCIHFFHALSGATLATIDCYAQVTSLVWSEKRKELAATFGFAQPEHPYRVAVFAWPSCRRIVGIPWWSEERALYAVAYPRGPSSGGSGTTSRRNNNNNNNGTRPQLDAADGKPWYGRRTRDEGCLVVATSDASIKFHEIWAKSSIHPKGKRGAPAGPLGGSQILEGECSPEVERSAAIR